MKVTSSVKIPQANIEDIRAAAVGLAVGEFVRLHPLPALAISLPGGSGSSIETKDADFRPTLDGETDRFSGALGTSARNYVVWLEKSGRNLFNNIISLGRAPLNDVWLPFNTVSKIHAVFVKVGDEWQLIDRGSRNGVYVNSQRVETSGKVALQCGDVLHFGRQLQGTFHTPEGLHDFLQK